MKANILLFRVQVIYDQPAQCPSTEDDNSCVLPKIIMISARPLEEREKAFSSWASHDVIVYNTTGKSVRIGTQVDIVS